MPRYAITKPRRVGDPEVRGRGKVKDAYIVRTCVIEKRERRDVATTRRKTSET